MAPVPIMSLLFKRETGTLFYGNTDEDDLILSCIMTAAHSWVTLWKHTLEHFPIMYNFCPLSFFSIICTQQSAAAAAVCTDIIFCARFLSHDTHRCAPTCQKQRENNTCRMRVCTDSCWSSHQLLPGAVLLVWGKVFGNLLCAFLSSFSFLQLEIKAFCFVLLFLYGLLSKQWPTGWQAADFSDNMKAQIRRSGMRPSRRRVKCQGRIDREKTWWRCVKKEKKPQSSVLTSTWITHSSGNKLQRVSLGWWRFCDF